MTRITFQVLSTILATLVLAPFAGATDSPSKEQQALMQSERDWATAWKNKDAKGVAASEADEYVFTNFDGTVSDKATDMADLKSGALSLTWEVDDMKAMVFGDTGVVVGRQTQKGMQGGKDISGVMRFTDTWVRRDGRWQCVASQITRIEKP